MAFHLFDTKPYPEAMMTYCLLDPKGRMSVELKSEYDDFDLKNAFEYIVCKQATILARIWKC